MPRGDRTGPAGAGPMTGRAAGFCAGNSVPGFMAGGFGMGMRRGGGSGRGFFGAGRGLGFARNFGGYGRFGCNPVWGETGGVAEKEILEKRAESLQQELDAVRKNLETLNGEA